MENRLLSDIGRTGTKVIMNGRIVTENNVIDDGVIIVRGDRIKALGCRYGINVPAGAEIIDAKGNLVCPGFIDIHCHGGGGFLFKDNADAALKAHLRHGTTSVLATLSYHMTDNEYIETFQKLEKVIKTDYGKQCIGVNMEGPYLNPRYGADTSKVRAIKAEDYERVYEAGRKLIRIWTFAPELDGAKDFAAFLKSKNIIQSAGHSEADHETVNEFIKNGLRLGCHLMNAMGFPPPFVFKGAIREVGIAEALLWDDDTYVEVIPDSKGVHVRPLMLKLILKLKGVNRVVAISDAFLAGALKDLEYIKDEKGLEYVPDEGDLYYNGLNQLCGSRLSMDYAIRNMMNHTGIGFVDAFKIGALNAAALLGMDDEIGSIREGKKANIIIADEKMNVKNVILEGRRVQLSGL